jgi:hypothetical protein
MTLFFLIFGVLILMAILKALTKEGEAGPELHRDDAAAKATEARETAEFQSRRRNLEIDVSGKSDWT